MNYLVPTIVAKQQKTSACHSKAHSKAWIALEQNLEIILYVVNVGKREVAIVAKTLQRLLSALENLDPKDKARVDKLQRSFNRSGKLTGPRLERYKTLKLWQVVMLVTCVEAYLQDLLAAAASVDERLMSKSEQAAPYTDIISARSLDELASELRARWARNWLSVGGPTCWISRFKKMGATAIPTDIASRLELAWGIRHVVVHAAGVASTDFVRRHPEAGKLGEHVDVPHGQFGEFLSAVRAFLEPVEEFFLRRFPSLGAPTASERPKWPK